jgi:hypothetical protein
MQKPSVALIEAGGGRIARPRSTNKTKRLPALTCPRCGREVKSTGFTPNRLRSITHAITYRMCLRRCEPCALGFSNRNTADPNKLCKIDRDAPHDIPTDILAGWDQVISHAINEANRPSKRERFLFWNSKDRVTWAIFRFLQMRGWLRGCARDLGIDWAMEAPTEPTMLMWGATVPPACGDAEAWIGHLKDVVDEISESRRHRFEPDVILDFAPLGLVIFECRLGSAEKSDPHHRNWKKCLSKSAAFADPEETQRSGLYDLARNWRVTWQLAERLNRPRIAVVSLRPFIRYRPADVVSLERFERSLRRDSTYTFRCAAWSELLRQTDEKPEWFTRFLNERYLL